MSRKEQTFWEVKPHRPIRYGWLARVADWRAGRYDGRTVIPQLPSVPPEELSAPLITPYLEPLNQSYQGSAEAENMIALRDVADPLVRRRILQRDIAEREDRSRTIQKQLDSLPEIPDDSVLSRRNATEQHADPLLVRARRLREYTAVRARAQAAKDRNDEEILALLTEFSEVSETIAIRGRALAVMVAQMRAHAMRRRGHYLRHLVRQHPDGPALIPYFGLSTPELPSWLENWPPGDEGTAEI
jgi:hypothetical protein